jgi:stearoyl-CoA desaturase (delta-9 desaturase)
MATIRNPNTAMNQLANAKLQRFDPFVRKRRDKRTAPWKARLFRSAPPIIIGGPLAALLISPFVLFHFGLGTADFLAMVFGHFLSIGGLTLGYHRSLAHKGVDLSNRTRKIALIMGAMAAQGPPSFWVAHHRAHHGDPDGSNDPHSPWADGDVQSTRIVAFMHAHIGWMFKKSVRFDSRFIRDIRKDSVALWVDKHYFMILLAGMVLPAAALNIGQPSLQSFLLSVYWVGLVRISITHQATWMVNSVCHLWGYRNYSTADRSRNNWLVAILTLGEGWHNNHHANPRNARHGQKWWEIDPTYLVICGLGRLKLARYRLE